MKVKGFWMFFTNTKHEHATRLFLLLLSAFFYLPGVARADTPGYKDGDVITADTVWEGRVVVEGVVFVPEGVTLTIRPGTVVSFVKSAVSYKEGDASEVLIPGSGIRVEGKVIAEGSKEGRITFTSAGDRPAPGDWGCIFFDHSKGSLFRYCIFEYSAYTLHAHFSRFDVSRSVIRHNEDGSRLGSSRASFDHCDITENTGKGLNFRQCRNTVTWCNITGNHEGIFLNEKDADCVVEKNNIYSNRGMDLRLGEFHAGDVSLPGNYWGSADPAYISAHVYDREDDPSVGSAVIVPAEREIIGAGVDGLSVDVRWRFKTGGFVDSSPAVSDDMVYFGSWDKNFYAVRSDTGELIWEFSTGDCVDSSPAVSDGRVFFGSWDRNIYCLDAKEGKQIWKFEMPPSNFDDHRQASPAASPALGMVYIGGFNGKVYALDLNGGKVQWEFKTGGPIRCRPFVAGDYLCVGSGDGRFYTLKADAGTDCWVFQAGAAVNSSPMVDNGRVYFGSRDGALYKLDGRDGKLLWSYDPGGRIEYSSPLIAGDKVLIGDCNGKLHAVNRDDGKPAWSFTGGGGIYSSPQGLGDRVVYGDNEGNVYVLDLKTGAPLGSFRAGDAVQGLSTGADGVFYAGSRDGFLYALTIHE